MDRHKKRELQNEALGKVRQEILAERAESLARITRTLERHLSRLHSLRRELQAAKAGRDEERTVSYETARRKAETWRWYLRIQREVNGLVDHEELEARYPIPGPPTR